MRLIILIAISGMLMIWNYRHPVPSQSWREKLSYMTTPVYYAIHLPVMLLDNMARNFHDHQSLVKENTVLREKWIVLSGQLLNLQALQSENQALRALLKSFQTYHRLTFQLAEVMAIQASPYVQEILLNKGSNDNVYVGQPIFDAKGIVGQVIEVTPLTARVLLLIDPKSGIPIRNNRTGLPGIITGLGNSKLLSWINVPPSEDVQVGDELVSSGLGGHYPAGYPVGVVISVNRHSNDQFLNIMVTPRAQMNNNAEVLLVWENKKSA